MSIHILYSNGENTIGSFFQSKITPFNRDMNLNFEPAFSLRFDKTSLKTIKTELSALIKFSDTFYIGVENGLAIIVVSENQTKMDITYKRSLFITIDSDIDADYSINRFISILKNLKSKEPVILVSTNQLMAIQDSNNTYVLGNKEIDSNAEI